MIVRKRNTRRSRLNERDRSVNGNLDFTFLCLHYTHVCFLVGTNRSNTVSTITETGTCTIKFDNDSEKAKAFYELIHSKAQFSGIEKDTIIIQKKDCTLLESKNIIYHKL